MNIIIFLEKLLQIQKQTGGNENPIKMSNHFENLVNE